jgi:hypothetical protein
MNGLTRMVGQNVSRLLSFPANLTRAKCTSSLGSSFSSAKTANSARRRRLYFVDMRIVPDCGPMGRRCAWEQQIKVVVLRITTEASSAPIWVCLRSLACGPLRRMLSSSRNLYFSMLLSRLASMILGSRMPAERYDVETSRLNHVVAWLTVASEVCGETDREKSMQRRSELRQ